MHPRTPTEYALRVCIDGELDIPVVASRFRAWAQRSGASTVDIARITTAAIELTTNVVKYAQRGELYGRLLETPGQRAIELIVEDRGPGIADVAQAIGERFSTGGTLGLGLPGVRRLMDEFEITSQLGRGTVVRALKRIE